MQYLYLYGLWCRAGSQRGRILYLLCLLWAANHCIQPGFFRSKTKVYYSIFRYKGTGNYHYPATTEQRNFIPKDIKNFDIERVRGIYIPFWLFSIRYADKQYLRGTVGSGKHKKTKYYYREADCDFTNLTLDASKQLNDETSQRLEPYDTHALQSFDIGYLSGFYADRYDMSDEQLQTLALLRAKTLFDQEVKGTIHASNIEILRNAPTYQIHNTEYALFPAWFLTFRYQTQPYTILVNGQTGKVIGAVPYDKPKVTIWFIVIGCIVSIISSFLLYGMLSAGKEIDETLGMVLVFAGTMFLLGSLLFRKVKKSVALTRAKETNTFVKERQEGM